MKAPDVVRSDRQVLLAPGAQWHLISTPPWESLLELDDVLPSGILLERRSVELWRGAHC